MATKIKDDNLLTLAKDRVKYAKLELVTAKLSLAKVRELQRLLPKSVLNQNWYVFRRDGNHQWYMETWGMKPGEADALVTQLKILGVCSIKSHFNQYNQSWCYEGSFLSGEDTMTVRVDGGSKPSACRVEEIKEVKEVITYKAICEETGEEVK